MTEEKEIVKRIVIYPVNVGDKVYILLPGRKRIVEATVKSISTARFGMYDYFYILASYKNIDNVDTFRQCIYGITAFKDVKTAEKELCGK